MANVSQPVLAKGDKVVVLKRGSFKTGNLLFVLNLENSLAKVQLQPQEKIHRAKDLSYNKELIIRDGAFELEIPPRSLKVVHYFKYTK